MKQILILLIIYTSTASLAQETHEHNHGHEQSQSGDHSEFIFGQAGAVENAIKTIKVTMTDNSYDLKSLNINSGDTVHFKINNQGQQIHEFTIATNNMHAEHQQEMLKHISEGHMSMTDKGHGAGHDHDNSLLLNPGERGELIWTFTNADNLEFACNVPGHYQSGMVGKIAVN